MFGWFKRPKQGQANLPRAFEMGRRSRQQFADDLEKLMTIRFEPVFEAYLDVVQKQFNMCLNSIDTPPIIAARMEYKGFLDSVDDLRSQMTGEIAATLSGWLEVADQRQSGVKFTELIQVEVQEFCHRLKQTGLQRFLDMAHALELADDEWRADNPGLSARFPPPG
jgi:hypothetical protein